jgi:long-chain acyl-CoA synthetase
MDAEGRERLEANLRTQIALINEHERPAAIALIERPFSIERGELTPNLKIRRAAVEESYAELIQRLYDGIDERTSSTHVRWS